MLLYWLSIIIGLASAIGCACLVYAMLLTSRFPRRALPAPGTSVPRVTILKPLHGAEPGLSENLASFCTQNYPGAVQIILGVQDPRDDAIAVVEQLRARYRDCHLDLVVDTTIHGLNRKVSNLVNMWRHVEHDVVVVADSDMRVDPDYLSRIVAALEQRGVGAVTCLYHGLPATGFWAQLAALGINAHFLPNVIMGLGLKLAQPCFGSTIAFNRKALVEIGGFIRVVNCLADDYAIGAALRARGYRISVSPITVGHVCGEMSASELWHHEVRWARTIRSLDPAGYAGSVIAHAFPLALIAALGGFAAESIEPVTALSLGMTAVGCRLALLRQVERAFNLPPQSCWLVPLRDVLSFTVFISSFFGQSARWKGRRYRFAAGGTLVAAGSSSPP
ncbi:MAG TPA: bacteriohopanetetrol glucosamine biosynthesis glycosyltransferase HpnI [Xanthobacteraceae bacterium]|nr:bacteriohopanetetrol glucosamine biosynthesis glycosyltransferase HpnI [Xanthobacteraceae bacterium]